VQAIHRTTAENIGLIRNHPTTTSLRQPDAPTQV